FQVGHPCHHRLPRRRHRPPHRLGCRRLLRGRALPRPVPHRGLAHRDPDRAHALGHGHLPPPGRGGRPPHAPSSPALRHPHPSGPGRLIRYNGGVAPPP